jgi:hypothetical protein
MNLVLFINARQQISTALPGVHLGQSLPAVAGVAVLQCARPVVNAPATTDHYSITGWGADAA